MMPTKKLNEGVVTSIADSDLVTVTDSSGALRPISFANLMAAVRGGIQVGGRNLLLREITSGCTTITISGNSVTVNSNADTYFSIKLAASANLVVGKSYTISFDCSGLASGASWVMQGSMNQSFFINLANGRNACTFVMTESQKGSLFNFDDGPRSFPNGFTPITLSNFKLERGNIATDWSPAPEDIADGSLGGGNWLIANYLPLGRERRCP